MQLAQLPSHTHLDGTWTAPSLSRNPFPFPGDGSHPSTEEHHGIWRMWNPGSHKEPSYWVLLRSLHPSPATRLPGCHGQSCWLQCQQPQSAPWVAGGNTWSASSSFCQALEKLSYGHWTQQRSSTPSKPPARNPKELSSASDGANLLPHHLSFPGPTLRYACTGGLFFLQRQEHNFLCSKATLQLQRNSSHFRYQEN